VNQVKKTLALAVLGAVMLGSCAPGQEVLPEPPQSVELEPLAPKPVPPSTAVPEAEEDPALVALWSTVEALELRDKVAGLVVASLGGKDPEVFRSFLEQHPVAGFVFFKGNVGDQLSGVAGLAQAIQEGQEYPLLLAVDQEGGPVERVPGDALPGAKTLGKGPTETTTEVFTSRQELLAQAQVTVNFGLVADLSPGSAAYIHPRAFGSDPDLVSSHVVAALEGSTPRVAQTLKHFPGHGMVFGDSHREIPVSTMPYQDWLSSHALPFRAGVDHGVELVMTAHIRVVTVSKDPASLSNDWIDILRGELGFEGVIITDDLGMLDASGEDAYQDPAATAVAALVAGNDLILLVADSSEHPTYATYGRIIDAMVEAVMSGLVSEDQVDQSLVRVLALRQSLVHN
jgi:beta-N-acetylhexosaminidase